MESDCEATDDSDYNHVTFFERLHDESIIGKKSVVAKCLTDRSHSVDRGLQENDRIPGPPLRGFNKSQGLPNEKTFADFASEGLFRFGLKDLWWIRPIPF